MQTAGISASGLHPVFVSAIIGLIKPILSREVQAMLRTDELMRTLSRADGMEKLSG